VSVCLDSWAVLAWLDGEEPALTRVNGVISSRPAISWVDLVEAARLKARATIALGDCFAATTAAAHGLALLTGDPELLDLADAPCALEDLRATQR